MPTSLAVGKHGRVIIHFDYDCFYASVFESKNPSLKSLPFAVQQKQIIVTCNYEARRRGLHKLQLITDAKRICPDVIIELGEDISPFRDASKELYNFIKTYSWNGKIERLGFDEVWLDVTDVIDYNLELLNVHDMRHAFFQTIRDDPTAGFSFDASKLAGHSYPADCLSPAPQLNDSNSQIAMRLCLGSHLALHIRHQLEQHKGYTSTVGVATTKLVSKLVGNLNKPKGQTTLMPPLSEHTMQFLDAHEIGKIPGIGFKTAQKLRQFVLGRPAEFDLGLVYGSTKEKVTVANVRQHPEIGPDSLAKLLAGPGSSNDVGVKLWNLLHGIDNAEVSAAKVIPSQISIEDSYIRLDTMPELLRQLESLATSLLQRMRIDLLVTTEDDPEAQSEPGKDTNRTLSPTQTRWLAHPRTLRLTTRPRQPLRPDGTRIRSFKRISHSAPLSAFVFSPHDSVADLAHRLVHESLLPMFHRLHPEKSGWNLSLVNLAVTNMSETAGDTRTAVGRDISKMFRRQEDLYKQFRVLDDGSADSHGADAVGDEDHGEQSRDRVSRTLIDETEHGGALPVSDHERPDSASLGVIEDDDDVDAGSDFRLGENRANSDTVICEICSAPVPSFVMIAHQRYHATLS